MLLEAFMLMLGVSTELRRVIFLFGTFSVAYYTVANWFQRHAAMRHSGLTWIKTALLGTLKHPGYKYFLKEESMPY